MSATKNDLIVNVSWTLEQCRENTRAGVYKHSWWKMRLLNRSTFLHKALWPSRQELMSGTLSPQVIFDLTRPCVL